MSKLQNRSRLELQLLVAVVLSLAVAAAAFWGLEMTGGWMVDTLTQQEGFQARQQQLLLERLQAYITQENLSIWDTEALDEWVTKERYMTLLLVKDDRILYDSTYSFYTYDTTLPPSAECGNSTVLTDSQPQMNVDGNWREYAPLHFSDGVVQANLYSFGEYQLYSLASGIAALLAFGFFCAVFVLLIRKKIGYITQLERELRILEGGDLSYPITLQGQDELGQLAQGIDDMRRSIIQRQQSEEEARTANRQLITAMSHDLRTPLTSLIGYLDILALGRSVDPAQQERFLRSSREKAYQIKDLSDKLFEYFLVYGREEESAALLPADGGALMMQTVGEQLFDLESRGFTTHCSLPQEDFSLQAEPQLLQRVFDNLFSNLVKYADPLSPVEVTGRLEHTEEGLRLVLTFQNRARTDLERPESTNIGLQTCETILALHGGGFSSRLEDGCFTATLWLPAYPPLPKNQSPHGKQL